MPFFSVCRSSSYETSLFSLLSFYSIFSRESIFIRIPERYDFERGIIHVKKQLCPPRKNDGSGKYYWGTLKNGKTRIIHPAPFVMDFDKPVCSNSNKESQPKGIPDHSGDCFRFLIRIFDSEIIVKSYFTLTAYTSVIGIIVQQPLV